MEQFVAIDLAHLLLQSSFSHKKKKRREELGYIAQWHEYAGTHEMLKESLLMFLPITRHVMTLIHKYSTLTDIHAPHSDRSYFTFLLR